MFVFPEKEVDNASLELSMGSVLRESCSQQRINSTLSSQQAALNRLLQMTNDQLHDYRVMDTVDEMPTIIND